MSRTANSTPCRCDIPIDGAMVCASNERIWMGASALTSTTPSGWSATRLSLRQGCWSKLCCLILRLSGRSVGSLEETGSRSEHEPRVKAQVRRKNRSGFHGGLLCRVGKCPSRWKRDSRREPINLRQLCISLWIDAQKFAGWVVWLRGRAGIGIVDYCVSGRHYGAARGIEGRRCFASIGRGVGAAPLSDLGNWGLWPSCGFRAGRRLSRRAFAL